MLSKGKIKGITISEGSYNKVIIYQGDKETEISKDWLISFLGENKFKKLLRQ